MVLVKKKKKTLKKIFTQLPNLPIFTQLKSTLVNRELRTVSHGFIIVLC